MNSVMKRRSVVVRVALVAAFCLFLHTSAAVAQTMYMVGNIQGVVNGTPVDFGLDIEMDMDTGEETATISGMDPAMGAILRPVTAMVTVCGPTGGATTGGGQNLFQLSGGNFVNSATMYWPATEDSLELIHTVSYSGGDTMHVSATINGTVPVISGSEEITLHDFTEIMYWDSTDCPDCAEGSQTVTTGVGFQGDFSKSENRIYEVGDDPFPGGAGKGSTTEYTGGRPSGPVLRSAKNISTTYDPVAQTMNVHLFNTLTPVEGPPAASLEH